MIIDITKEELELIRWVCQDVASDYIGADDYMFDQYLSLSDKLDEAEKLDGVDTSRN